MCAYAKGRRDGCEGETKEQPSRVAGRLSARGSRADFFHYFRSRRRGPR